MAAGGQSAAGRESAADRGSFSYCSLIVLKARFGWQALCGCYGKRVVRSRKQCADRLSAGLKASRRPVAPALPPNSSASRWTSSGCLAPTQAAIAAKDATRDDADRHLRASAIRSRPAWSPVSSRPGGNVTGVTSIDCCELGAQDGWNCLREIVPRCDASGGAACDPTTPERRGSVCGAVQARCASDRSRSDPVMIMRDSSEIERGLCDVAGDRMPARCASVVQHELLPQPSRSSRWRLDTSTACDLRTAPAFAALGGLLSYRDQLEATRSPGAAIYVDKIFKGAKPADLPVQQPTRSSW